MCLVESVPILMISSHLALHLRPGDKLYKSRCTHAARRNFFVERVIDVWNYLLPTVNLLLCQLLRVH